MSYGAPYPRYGGGQPPPIPPRPVMPRNASSNNTPYPTQSNSFPAPYGSGYGGGVTPSYGGGYTATTDNNVSRVTEIDQNMKQLTDDLINGVIKSARNEDLESLIDNDEKILELINDSQITKDLKRNTQEMDMYNKDKAQNNLSLKPEFEQLQTVLKELAQKQNELRERYLEHQSKVSSSLSSDAILSLLQVAAGEQETLSDDMKMNFYDGDLSVDEFIKQFVDGRKLYQLRKIKSEKLRGILTQHSSQQYSSGYGRMPPPVPRPVTYGAQFTTPYPQ